jgi:hypothetical protein
MPSITDGVIENAGEVPICIKNVTGKILQPYNVAVKGYRNFLASPGLRGSVGEVWDCSQSIAQLRIGCQEF